MDKHLDIILGILLLFILIAFIFYKKQKAKKPLFVLYYAPWCGFCKRAKPEFDKINLPYVECRSVNCDSTFHKREVEQMGIDSYPTFYLFKDGNLNKNTATRYDGERSCKHMEEFLKSSY
tara:strand:- start:144 stop:503 length:360 start_codon:yes stop_codon:yes gene_type:complete